uniref:Uncharacterized protein n=1 Tax=Dulem virus 32 TaxID=3145750 RepID=A0AAU8B2I7_9CAUD
MKLFCPEYPNLFIPKYGVQFIEGVAEAGDANGKAILKSSPHVTAETPEGLEGAAPKRQKNN